MKKHFLMTDLALCLIWALAVLGNRYVIYINLTTFVVCVLFVISRITASYSLAQSEKHSWIPIVEYMSMFIFLIMAGRSFGVYEMVHYISPVLNIKCCNLAEKIIMVGLLCWLIVLPAIYYLVLLFKKKTVKTPWSKTDLMGTLLWKDRVAKSYSAILLTAIIAMLIGLCLNARLCLIACVAAPFVTFVIIIKHYGIENRKWWMFILTMLVFHQAQHFAGIIRIGMLITSLLVVGFLCYPLLKRTGNYLSGLVLIVYLGIILPSICIGYNQYSCINYARKGFLTAQPFTGLFYVSDSTGELVGLRDRYNLILKPQYERIVCKQSDTSYWTCYFELHRLGYIRTYSILSRKFMDEPCNINELLQRDVCHLIDCYMSSLDYGDRCQIRIVELVGNKEIANARVSKTVHSIYDYRNKNFMPNDCAELESGTFACDSMISFQYEKKRVMSYAQNAPNDSVPKYKVFVKLATTSMPDSLTLKNIADNATEFIIERCR